MVDVGIHVVLLIGEHVCVIIISRHHWEQYYINRRTGLGFSHHKMLK